MINNAQFAAVFDDIGDLPSFHVRGDNGARGENLDGFQAVGADLAGSATETAMWTCRNCNARFAFDEVESQIDEDGFFFICRGCDYRNKLVNIGPDATGCPQLVQSDAE